MTRARPEAVVLGEGSYSRAVAQVFDALAIPDDWLIRWRWGAATPFAVPLLKCRRVFQVTSDADASTRMRWRHDAFWRFYGALGGKLPASAPGLKWLLLDCRNGGASGDDAPSPYCHPVPAAGGLKSILSAFDRARSHSFDDWHGSMFADKEVASRVEIYQLVRQSERTDENRGRILNLAEQLLPLQWERFCPPPDEHALANRLRTWLRKPVTGPVTPWFVEGESLLRQTTLAT